MTGRKQSNMCFLNTIKQLGAGIYWAAKGKRLTSLIYLSGANSLPDHERSTKLQRHFVTCGDYGLKEMISHGQ